MIKLTCNFPQRIRLLQWIGAYPAVGLPQQRECMRLLDAVEPSEAEKAEVDLVIDVANDRITWSDQKAAAADPTYELSLDKAQAAMLIAVLDKAVMHPLADRWIVPVSDEIRRQL